MILSTKSHCDGSAIDVDGRGFFQDEKGRTTYADLANDKKAVSSAMN
jgi:hypothetical protein